MGIVIRRKCNTCGLEKPTSELVPSKKYHGGYMPMCKPCRNEYWRKRRSENPDASQRHRDAVRRSQILSSYGLGAGDYERMVQEQENRCKLCGSGDTGRQTSRFHYWNIDHCHKTGNVRGLLCHVCNITLGKFEALELRIGRARILDYLDKAGDVVNAPPPQHASPHS